MKRIIALLFIIVSFSAYSKSSPPGNVGKGRMIENSHNFQMLPQQKKNEIMEIQAQLLQKEASINTQLRELRNEMNKCMLSDHVDMVKYRRLKEDEIRLKGDKMRLRDAYMREIHKILNQQPK